MSCKGDLLVDAHRFYIIDEKTVNNSKKMTELIIIMLSNLFVNLVDLLKATPLLTRVFFKVLFS